MGKWLVMVLMRYASASAVARMLILTFVSSVAGLAVLLFSSEGLESLPTRQRVVGTIAGMTGLAVGMQVAMAWTRRRMRSRSPIDLPPGSRARAVLSLFFSKKSMQRVFEPIIADMQEEWREAHEQGAGRFRLAIMRLRWWFSLTAAVGGKWVVSVIKFAVKQWKSG